MLQANLKANGSIVRESESEHIKKYSYPETVLIKKGMGVSDEAIWDFRQGEAAGLIDQYPLNIYFRIPKSAGELKEGEGLYNIIHEVSVNGRKLDRDEYGRKDKKPIPLYLVTESIIKV